MNQFLLILLMGFATFSASAQVLFMEDCFVGGVTVGGFASISHTSAGYCKIKWEADFSLRKAYAITYRYGRPAPYSLLINGDSLMWNLSSQAGPELPQPNLLTDYFAAHAEEITDQIQFSSDSIYFKLPPQNFYSENDGWGWWGVYLVILYEAPTINESICLRIYTADQADPEPQNYFFGTPEYNLNTDVALSVFFNRLSDYSVDRSVLWLNGDTLGEVWTSDHVPQDLGTGVQGHFFYQNGVLTGLSDDVANDYMYKSDGIAVINSRLVQGNYQNLYTKPFENSNPQGRANPFPAFVLTYTPECDVMDYELQRYYEFCPGDTVQFSASGFDSYSWSPAAGLSDTSIANPLCFADSSRWYYVTMKSEGGCSITQPVKAWVHPAPAPAEVRSTDNVCPEPNGALRLVDPAGLAPFTYELDGRTQSENLFDSLLYGFYPYTITDARGCTFSDTAEVKLKTEIFAGFEPTPRSGDTPLEVFFQNQSHNAQNFLWQWEGQTFSTAENPLYTFTDTGTFVITQIAYNGEP